VSHLHLACGLLKDRLVRRGLAPTADSPGVLLAADGVSAAVPEPLAAATVRAAVRASMGGASQAGAASASAVTLLNEVLLAAIAFKLTEGWGPNSRDDRVARRRAKRVIPVLLTLALVSKPPKWGGIVKPGA
jgi:hypothetical protein